MIKLILPVVIIAAIIGFASWKLINFNKPAATALPASATITTVADSPSPLPLSSSLAAIPQTASEDPVLIKRVNDLSSTVNQIASFKTQLKDLQTTAADLSNRVTKLETSSPTTSQGSSTQTTTSKSPQYIPMVTSATSSALDWEDVSGQDIQMNGDDYPGYTSMYLEASLQCFQANGTSYARLKNVDDGTSILASQISTSSQVYIFIQSASFKLPSGKKTYRLQLKTQTTYAANIQNVRIKVVY